jgi:hypothetical protein
MVVDLSSIMLSASPPIRANETKLIAVIVDGSASCNFQLMDLSGLADRPVPQRGIDDLPPVSAPPALNTYFCNISSSLVVDLTPSMEPSFNARMVVANMSELPRFFTGGILGGGEHFVSDGGDIVQLHESAGGTFVPADGNMPCGPGHPAWKWRFPNGGNDSCTLIPNPRL